MELNQYKITKENEGFLILHHLLEIVKFIGKGNSAENFYLTIIID